MIVLIGNIIKANQPKIYRKLIILINKQDSNLVNQLKYREQPEFEEDNYEFRKIRNMMTRKKAVKL